MYTYKLNGKILNSKMEERELIALCIFLGGEGIKSITHTPTKHLVVLQNGNIHEICV